MFELVYTVTVYYDGPRRGIANFFGEPHLYESEWSDESGDTDTFLLTPLDAETVALALEDWAIWRRWEDAFQQGRVNLSSTPALPGDRPRHQELAVLLSRQLVTDLGRAIRKCGEFRARQEAAWSGPGLRPLEVRWYDPA